MRKHSLLIGLILLFVGIIFDNNLIFMLLAAICCAISFVDQVRNDLATIKNTTEKLNQQIKKAMKSDIEHTNNPNIKKSTTNAEQWELFLKTRLKSREQ